MSENKETAENKAVQTDKESQEYGSQHGQDTQGHETGSSSPMTSPQDDVKGINETAGDAMGVRAGDFK